MYTGLNTSPPHLLHTEQAFSSGGVCQVSLQHYIRQAGRIVGTSAEGKVYLEEPSLYNTIKPFPLFLFPLSLSPSLPLSQRSEVLGVFRQQLCRELQVLETEVMRTQKSEEKAISLLQEQMKIHTSSCKTQQKQ